MAKVVLRSYEEENLRRKKFRLVFLFIAIPLLAIILIYDGKIASMFSNAQASVDHFAAQEYDQSRDAGDKQKNLNFIESWLAYYNAGTARVALHTYFVFK